MFTDGRSKKVVFLAHCLLNQNAISDGTAAYPAAFQELIRFFLDNEVGIVQLPCPELCCLGLDRGNVLGAQSPVTVENTRIRTAMGASGPARRLAVLVDHVMLQWRPPLCKIWRFQARASFLRPWRSGSRRPVWNFLCSA